MPAVRTRLLFLLSEGLQPVDAAAGAIGADDGEARAAIDELRESHLVDVKAVTQWGDDISTATAFIGLTDAGKEQLARTQDRLQASVPSRLERLRHRVELLYYDPHARAPIYVACPCGAAWPLFDEYTDELRADWWKCPHGHNADTG